MKAKKLPSGNWNCLVYSHTDSAGKRVYESFTAPSKREVEMLAMQFKANKDRLKTDDITVKEAVEQYIESNKNVLSPSTLRGYMMDAKRMGSINHKRIKKLKSVDIQTFVSEQAAIYAPKTVKNTYALLMASLSACDVDTRFKVNLPTIPKKRKIAPENEQIVALFNSANPIMKKAIVLAAFHSLRRGEICGLKYGDITDNSLYVHSDMVKGPDGWVHKDIPKTESSNRTLILTEKELEVIGTGKPNEYIVPRTPTTLDHNFKELTKKLGIEGVTLHTLRSYFASVAVAIGIPDLYASHMGGWRENSSVLKEYYQKKIVSMDEAYADKMNSYFENVMDKAQDDCKTKNKKSPYHAS